MIFPSTKNNIVTVSDPSYNYTILHDQMQFDCLLLVDYIIILIRNRRPIIVTGARDRRSMSISTLKTTKAGYNAFASRISKQDPVTFVSNF